MNEKSLLRLHLLGMLGLVVLLSLSLGSYFIIQQNHDFERDSRAMEQREEQQLEQNLTGGLLTLKSYLHRLRGSAEEEQRLRIREQVDLAWQLADHLYQSQRTRLNDQQLRNLITETLRPLRFFDGHGYYFINDLDGNSVLQPLEPEREGQSQLGSRDDTGHYIMLGLLSAADNSTGRGFSRYRWHAPDNNGMEEKIAYVRRFEPFDWLIGSGDYLSNAEQQLRNQALQQLRNTRIARHNPVAVVDFNGRMLLSPGRPQSEGLPLEQLEPDERHVVSQILATSRQGGGMLRYPWYKPDSGNRLHTKLSMVSNLDDWGWILVTGVFLDELEASRTQRELQLRKDLNQRLVVILSILGAACLLVMVFSLFYSHWLSQRFHRYRADLQASEIRLRQYAETDQLTGLPNHLRLSERLEEALKHTDRHSEHLALLCIDIDHFKNVNDSLGHGFGDRLLQLVALQLDSALGPGTTLSRSGGDEFVVLLENCKGSSEAATVASALLEACRGSHLIEGQELSVTLSIGIALYPEDGEDIQTLRRNADAAMYHAKSSGRNNYQFFTESMNRRVLEHLQVENLLRQAIARNELRLEYQPKVNLSTGCMAGCEALLRWYSPQLGEVPPSTFIPVAEECGLIVQLGAWALHEACRQSAAWQQAGLPPLRVAVNVSAKQFSQSNLPELVRHTLASTGLSADLLELELTESVLAEDFESLQSTLNRLRDMGIHLTMDDFGTGFSSLSYLNQFHLDTLKIDRAFVRDLPGNGEHHALTTAIIAMAGALNMHCVAEGIETREQMELLHNLGCDLGQGFLFARPLPARAIAELLRQLEKPLLPT